ncbi:MAG: hypothetical protein H5T34_04230 [Candidatus Methanomethyliales bacterium]|nr:hypothetical protein [Candidatus Bipolaricaulota bacterium]MBC7113212.1 hypothetical protein [Candidatus Methanomethylicales archaeon]
MTEDQASPSQDPGMPRAPDSIFNNEQNKDTSISTPSIGNNTANTDTNTLGGVYTNTIQIQTKNCVRAIRVNELQWKSFLQKARELGYSANELINHFINSIVSQTPDFPSKTPLTFNIAIAKAEAKPVINVGEYVAKKELDELIQKVAALKSRAEKERQHCDMPTTFTVERAKVLEAEIKKALRGVKSLPPEKLQEVEAALSVLKGIREGERR